VPGGEDSKKIKTLICDDRMEFARGLKMILDADYPDIEIVGIAQSGEEAIAKIQTDPPDVVLIDIYMPGMGGIEAIRRIHRIAPLTSLVALTSSDSETDVYEAIEAGAVGFASKDSDLDYIGELVAWIRTLSSPVDSPRVTRSGSRKGSIPLAKEEEGLLAAIGDGRTDDEIAEARGIGVRQLRREIAELYRRLNISDRMEAALYAYRRGLTEAGQLK
jgi:DNA-binding NarL/FixJ family response regulator